MVNPRVGWSPGVLVGLASLLLLAGCGGSAAPSGSPTEAATPDAVGIATTPPAAVAESPSPEVAAGGLVDESYLGPFLASATVLAKDDGGPQLCVGAIGASYPPACGGPLIANWDWDAVKHQTHAGVRFGSYVLQGSFDGTTFTLTAPAETFTGQEVPRVDDEVNLTPQCPEPVGGWRPADVSATTEATLREALRLAQTLDGYAGAWVNERPRADDTAARRPDPGPPR